MKNYCIRTFKNLGGTTSHLPAPLLVQIKFHFGVMVIRGGEPTSDLVGRTNLPLLELASEEPVS